MATFNDLPLDLQRIIYGKKFKMESKELLVEEMVKYHKMYEEMADPLEIKSDMLCGSCLEVFDDDNFGGCYARWDLGKDIEFCLCVKCVRENETYETDGDFDWYEADLPPNHCHEQDCSVIKYNPFLENQEAIEDLYKAYKLLDNMPFDTQTEIPYEIDISRMDWERVFDLFDHEEGFYLEFYNGDLMKRSTDTP
jgi:hypothetical protein